MLNCNCVFNDLFCGAICNITCSRLDAQGCQQRRVVIIRVRPSVAVNCGSKLVALCCQALHDPSCCQLAAQLAAEEICLGALEAHSTCWLTVLCDFHHR